MRVPHSPHNLRRVVKASKSSDEEESGSESPSKSKILKSSRPPRPATYTSKGKDGKYTVGLAEKNNNSMQQVQNEAKGGSTEQKTSAAAESPIAAAAATSGFHRSRERTRVSAVQRLVERKLAQKEKEKLKQREKDDKNRVLTSTTKRSASTHGCCEENGKFVRSRRTDQENEYLASLLLRTSRSCERPVAEDAAKTYITITAGKPARIREHSPSKKASRRNSVGSSSGNSSNSGYSSSEDEAPSKTAKLKDNPPLKSTGLFREFTFINENLERPDKQRKTSFTTERTFVVNPPPTTTETRRISVDVSYSSKTPTSDSSTPTPNPQKRCNNSPNFSTSSSTSSGFSSSSSNLSSSSSGSNSSSSSSTDISSIGSQSDKDLSRRRISLEQRFRARTVKPTVFPSENKPEPQPRLRQRKSSSRLAAAASAAAELAALHRESIEEEAEVKGPQLGSGGGYRFHKTTTVQGVATGFKFSSVQRKFSQNDLNSQPRPPRASRKISLPSKSDIQEQPEEAISEDLTAWSFHKDNSIESQADQKKEEGNQLYKTKNYREALQKYSEAIGLCPQTASFYGNRSACHMMLSQFGDALVDAQYAVQLDKDFVKGYVRVAKCCISLGDVVSATKAIDSVLALEPTNQAIKQEQHTVAQLVKFQSDTEQAYLVKDFRKALFCIDRALSIAVASRALKVARAECLAYLGRYGEAQEIANDMLRSDSMNADAVFVRGLCLYYEDNVDKAFTHFQHVLRLAPDHQKAKDIYKKAKLLKQKKEEGNEAFKAGRLTEAHSLYSEALAIDPCNKFTNAKLYFNRATVAAKLKRLEDSVKDCTSALELDEKYLKALLRRAKSYMDLDQFEEAVRDYEAAHRMDRGNNDIRQSLKQAKVRLMHSKKKDYYKILGVDRGANDDEIKKAYKKRALATHPDRHASATESQRREQENKFKEIGEAYDVLSDTKKRSRYDNGHDLDDLEGGGFGEEIDPNQMFQAFFGGAGMRSQGFQFGGGPGGGQSFSFQFG